MGKTYIIDGNSLLFRAYYATAYGENPIIMRSKDGTPTNAIFAFSNMINKIITSFKGGEKLFVGFDTGKKTFRHEEDENYKANRKPAPKELITQMPIAREMLAALNIFTYEQDGIEGDDVCGTMAKMASKNGDEVIVFTSDRDFLQLIDENITIRILKKGLSDVMDVNPSVMQELYGFSPKQIVDYKGLRGDSSDNLPGIPGIGEKTAIKLIKDYGSFDEIVKQAPLMKSKIGKNIIDNEKLGRLCLHLAEIRTNEILPFGVEDIVYRGYDFEKINAFCQKYELRQLLNKLPTKLKLVNDENIDVEPTLLTSLNGIDFSSNVGIYFDSEEGNYHLSEVYGLSIATKNANYYIKKENFSDEGLRVLLSNKSIAKYCFDSKATIVIANRFSLILEGVGFDLLLGSYLLDSSLKTSVESVMNYFGIDVSSTNSGDLLSKTSNMTRSAKIAYYSLKLQKKVFDELQKHDEEKLYKTIELPLAGVLAKMEIEGFPIDIQVLNQIGDNFKSKLNVLTQEIHDLAGENFNIASPKQVSDILFNKLKLGDAKSGTSVEVLNSLKGTNPIVDKILEYRKYAKLVTTYVDALGGHVFADGKIHAMFNQAETTTGRLSSSEPNLQNISVRDEEGKLIRKAFYYKDENYEILSLDYSQIELRILASLSHCKALIDIFNENKDIHSATAKKVFHLDEDPTSLQRRKAKAVNFGIVYGISDWGLSEQLDIPVFEAKNIINAFYNAYPEVGEYLQNSVFEATKNGFVTTLLGRRRYLREINDTNYQTREFAKRAAMNAPIQGTAADLIKLAMVEVDEALAKNNYKTKIICQIHDELLFKVPLDEKEVILPLVKQIMEHAFNLDVNLSVDGGYGRSWYDAK